MTDDKIEVLKQQIGDLICNTLRVGGLDRIRYTVGALLATASALGTDEYDDAGDAIADMFYRAMFGMRIRDAYQEMETDGWTSRPLYMCATLDSPSGDRQEVAIGFSLFNAQEFFEIEVSVDLCLECLFPYSNMEFYSNGLHRYPLSDVARLQCTATELRVKARQQGKQQPPSVQFEDIGIEGIPHLAPADMAVANGYEWLRGQVIMTGLLIVP